MSYCAICGGGGSLLVCDKENCGRYTLKANSENLLRIPVFFVVFVYCLSNLFLVLLPSPKEWNANFIILKI